MDGKPNHLVNTTRITHIELSRCSNGFYQAINSRIPKFVAVLM